MSDFFVKHKKILIIIFAIALAVLLIPMISAGAYTYLCEDDFSFEGAVEDLIRDYGNIYVGAVHRMIEYYNTNQGTYVFNFLMSALHMYTRGGLPGLHFFMVISLAAFFLSLILLIKQIIKDWAGTLGITLASVLTLTEMYNTYRSIEIFFWYTGVLNFLLPFIFSLITATLSLHNIKTGKTRFAVIGMITGFIASGCALNVTAANCAWLLAILVLSYPKIMKRKTIVLPFAGAFVGAIINAAAPGNFNRLDGTPINIFTGLSNNFLCYISDFKLLFSSRIFWFSLILCFAITVLLKIKILPNGVSNLQLAITMAGSWLVQYFTLFPVSFANRLTDISGMDQRTFSACEVVIKLMFIFSVLILAQWISERKEKTAEYASVVLVAISLFFLLITYPTTKNEFKGGISYMVIDDFRSGAMVENYNTREYVISSLENAEEGTDTIIYIAPFRIANSMYGMGLDTDSGWFVNRSAAGLFNLNSVTVIYTD